MRQPYTVAFIFARGGSKGVLRKNVRLLAGKPLLAYSIEAARASRLIDRVIVSTEDAEIAQVARTHGAEVPFIRPPELADDDAPEWGAWQHALHTLEELDGRRPEIFVSVPPTSPLRSVMDIDACIRLYQEVETDIVITVRPADRNPFFNMVVLDEGNRAQLVIPPSTLFHRRQQAPAVYDMTTVAYVADSDFILTAGSIFEGHVRAVVIPAERALDIDTELDFQFADFILSRS